MDNNITIQLPALPSKESIESIHQMALMGASSNMYDSKLTLKLDKLKMVMMVGYTLGINPIFAPNYIYEFNNKFGMLTKAMLGLVHKSGQLNSMESGDLKNDNGDVIGKFVEMSRKNPGGEPIFHREEFTLRDAQKAGLIDSTPSWKKFPLRMCYWRASSWACSVLFSDVIGGMMSTEEIGMNHDFDGNVIPSNDFMDSSFSEIKKVDINSEFQKLLVDYGPELVFSMGEVPKTVDELNELTELLKASNDQEVEGNE